MFGEGYDPEPYASSLAELLLSVADALEGGSSAARGTTGPRPTVSDSPLAWTQ